MKKILTKYVSEGMDVVIAKTYRMDDFKEAYKGFVIWLG
jgi:hypothetical protein